ncbi:MAG: acyl-CoA dehydrogenase family protein [Candidatus Bathyarchaeia archaeon]
MDFSFTEEQQSLRMKCREFLRREILPTVEHYDEAEEFPWENMRKMAAEGFLGWLTPRELGGRGFGEVEYGILLEELGRVCSAHAAIVGAHVGLCTVPLLLMGNNEQRRKYLPKLAVGEKLGAFALTEPTAGSDAASLKLSATKKNGRYILEGSKIFVTNGNVADIVIVFASTDPNLGPRGGITAFIVEKDTLGFRPGKIEKKMGIRASTTAELIFRGCEVGEENILGPVGFGFPIALTTLDGGRVGLAAAALGSIEYAMDLVVEHLRKKKKLRLSTPLDQDAPMALADIAMNARTARFLVYHTLAEMDAYFKRIVRGEKVPGHERSRVTRNSAIAKAWVSEIASSAIEKCLAIHGPLGCIEGSGVEKLYRDSLISEIFEGTNEIQRLIIAENIISEEKQ